METKIFGGKEILIRKLSKKDLRNAKRLQDFINSLVEEGAQILINERKSLKQEKKWIQEELIKIKGKKMVFLVAESDNKLISTTEIELGRWRQVHVGNLGISIRKGYRGIGLGTYLMGKIIKLAEKELKPKPKIIRLSVFPTNKPAQELYRKMGFKKVAKIPKQIRYKGKLLDEIIMLLYL